MAANSGESGGRSLGKLLNRLFVVTRLASGFAVKFTIEYCSD